MRTAKNRNFRSRMQTFYSSGDVQQISRKKFKTLCNENFLFVDVDRISDKYIFHSLKAPLKASTPLKNLSIKPVEWVLKLWVAQMHFNLTLAYFRRESSSHCCSRYRRRYFWIAHLLTTQRALNISLSTFTPHLTHARLFCQYLQTCSNNVCSLLRKLLLQTLWGFTKSCSFIPTGMSPLVPESLLHK